MSSYREPIHLMLTDVVMPQMSGRELAQRLGQLRPEIKVLYMSGYTEDAIVLQNVLDSPMLFLQKPFSYLDLIRQVRKVLDLKGEEALKLSISRTSAASTKVIVPGKYLS